MIILMKKNATQEQIDHVTAQLRHLEGGKSHPTN
jgi:hypothetical protein